MYQSTTLSLAEENYLKTIYHLANNGTGNVPTNKLAHAMRTKAASVTSMLKKLCAKKFIAYKKYYGASITAKGKNQALYIVRKHRLWETFLVKKLHFSWDEIHEIAEQLEHIQSPLLIQKLDSFLGYPKVDPHGTPIPDSKGVIRDSQHITLKQALPGYKGIIVSVKNEEVRFLQYLNKLGVNLGSRIRVLSKEEYSGSMEIALKGKVILVATEILQNILVSPPKY